MRRPTIAALGGGGFSMTPDDLRLDAWLLSLTRRERPRVCFLPTASGDSDDLIQRFYQAFETFPCTPTHLGLFRREVDEITGFLLAQDLIYVGGGNTANMLAVWRVHGVDLALRAAWEAGVVLAGLSAGSLCWFEAGTTDSFGGLAPLRDGLGLLPGSHCPHYDGEALRRPRSHAWVKSGALPAGWAVDDGAALQFVDGALVGGVATDGRGAYRVERDGDGDVVESAVAVPMRTL